MNIRLDRLVGRKVLGPDGRPMGRLEEFRAEQRGDDWFVIEYVIGPSGLLERLGLGRRRVPGSRRRGFLARWDQLDVTDAERPRLLCSVQDLRPY